MSKINVAVLFGGCSTEHEISKMSAATVISNIVDDQYHVIPVYITKEGKWLFYDGSCDHIQNINWDRFGTPAVLSPDRTHRGLLRIVGEKVKCIPIDVIFPVLHGRMGEDGTLQGLFELCGIPYVGCNVLSSAVCMDKSFAKLVVDSLGIAQTEYMVVKEHEITSREEILKKIRYKIGYPCFVKPANAGSSVGISKVGNKTELEKALELAFSFDTKIVVEKGIVGRELECAVLGSGGDDTEASVIGEIIPTAEFYDYDAKYRSKQPQTTIPADIADMVSDEIRQTAVKIFKTLDCSGLARVDFFLEESGRVVFNEINTMPGFTNISMYPILFEEMGLGLPELLDRLIKLAIGVNEGGQ